MDTINAGHVFIAIGILAILVFGGMFVFCEGRLSAIKEQCRRDEERAKEDRISNIERRISNLEFRQK